jgi:serine/threonine-protein kinase
MWQYDESVDTGVRNLPDPGSTLAGKYLLKRVIGRGGMGVVYEAENTRIRQRVAIKMILPTTAGETSMLVRFQREARAAGRLKSPYVARVLDSDVTQDGLPYMVLEYLEGVDLAAVAKSVLRVPHARAVSYVLQACAGMAEAHKAGIVHRDLKLSNLFLADEDGTKRIKVLDFGISKVGEENEEHHLTSTMMLVGTPHFMAPEQIQNSRNVDARADIWSLGVILYRLITGKLPFEGNSLSVAAAIMSGGVVPIRATLEEVPEGLSFVVSRALRRDPARRFQNMQAFAKALAPYAAGSDDADASGAIAAVSHPSLTSLAAVVTASGLDAARGSVDAVRSSIELDIAAGAEDEELDLYSLGSPAVTGDLSSHPEPGADEDNAEPTREAERPEPLRTARPRARAASHDGSGPSRVQDPRSEVTQPRSREDRPTRRPSARTRAVGIGVAGAIAVVGGLVMFVARRDVHRDAPPPDEVPAAVAPAVAHETPAHPESPLGASDPAPAAMEKPKEALPEPAAVDAGAAIALPQPTRAPLAPAPAAQAAPAARPPSSPSPLSAPAPKPPRPRSNAPHTSPAPQTPAPAEKEKAGDDYVLHL